MSTVTRLTATEPATRALPANIEAEAAFLGAVLIDNSVLDILATPIEPGHFFEPVHARIFERIVEEREKGGVVNALTLRPHFEADTALQELGGVTYLARLQGDGQGLLAPRELAQQIFDLARLRDLVAIGRQLSEAALDTSEAIAPAVHIELANAALDNLLGAAGGRQSSAKIEARPYQWCDPANLPRRPWLYGHLLLRGSVFVLIAPGATGKSALLTGMALALCTGKSLLNQQVWGGAKRVWLWNLEDSLTDLRFSIQAAALHWGLSESDIGARLFVDSGLDGAPLKLARMTREGPEIDARVSRRIREQITSRAIDVLAIDPFISSHGLTDENDNAAIDTVAKEWARIATATGCAIVLVHHAKKLGGAEVNAESSRGASSLVDAARGGLALNTMTKADADGFGIPQDQRRRFFRADDAKPNRAPAGAGQWFEIVSAKLGNGDNGGDSVGVATPWSAPDPFEDVSTNHLRLVQAKIAEGAWRENIQASEWAGMAVAEVLGLDLEVRTDKLKAKAVLRTWIANGALSVAERPDLNGDVRKFVIVGEAA